MRRSYTFYNIVTIVIIRYIVFGTIVNIKYFSSNEIETKYSAKRYDLKRGKI